MLFSSYNLPDLIINNIINCWICVFVVTTQRLSSNILNSNNSAIGNLHCCNRSVINCKVRNSIICVVLEVWSCIINTIIILKSVLVVKISKFKLCILKYFSCSILYSINLNADLDVITIILLKEETLIIVS